MTNKHIELVKTWIADNDSVSRAELKVNTYSARAELVANPSMAAEAACFATDAAAYSSDAAYYSFTAPDAVGAEVLAAEGAKYWVKRYEEML